MKAPVSAIGMPPARAIASPETAPRRMYVITLGFGASVGMWLTGYVCHLPSVSVAPPLAALLMLLWLPAAGVAARRLAGATWRGGAMAGLVSGLLNLLILGSVIGSGRTGGDVVPSAALWIPGSLLLSAMLAALGAAAGGAAAGLTRGPDWWRSAFGVVASVATLLVVIAGGLVTSTDAGLAVPDWPSSYGWNMFLYPLAQMTAASGIYFEHAHRLYGSLVGLTTIVLAAVLWAGRTRAWRTLAIALVVLVIGQGVLGGTRVVATNLPMAIVHGVLGQVFFVMVTLTWATMTGTWRDAPASPSESAPTDRTLSGVYVGIVFLQLASGALYRHMATEQVPMPWPAHLHLTLAAVVACFGFVVGLRMCAKYAAFPMLRRFGTATLVLLGLQLLLGIAALIAVLARRGEAAPFEVVVATAHQANGALVFACAAQMALWVRRLLSITARPSEFTTEGH